MKSKTSKKSARKRTPKQSMQSALRRLKAHQMKMKFQGIKVSKNGVIVPPRH